MALSVKRKPGESFEAMLRRFSKRFQRSGTGKQVKKTRFHTEKKSKTAQKISALRRIELQKEYDKMKRMGTLPEPKKGRRR